mgnify:CR=1 FL=1
MPELEVNVSDKPQIASSSCDNCAKHGLSVMRAALGYTGTLPPMGDGAKEISDVLHALPDWFPDHEIKVFTSREIKDAGVPDGIVWLGYRPHSHFDFDPYVVGFSYYTTDNERSHFVVGQPILYEHMKSAFCVLVKKRSELCV